MSLVVILLYILCNSCLPRLCYAAELVTKYGHRVGNGLITIPLKFGCMCVVCVRGY